MFETSRNLRKLPSLLAKFVDKAADSMTALEAPNTRKDETVPSQVTNANTAGIKLKTIKLFKPILPRFDLGINLGITECHRYPICRHKHVFVPKKCILR